MTGKRSFCDTEHSSSMVARHATQGCDIWQPLCKRACGGEREDSLSCSSLLDLQASHFLHQLAASSGCSGSSSSGCGSAAMQHWSGLNEMVWRCMAELNLLMSAHFNNMPACELKSYHSFTRSDKHALVQRFAAACGVGPSSTQPVPLHLTLAQFVLGRAWGAYPQAAMTKVSFEVPHWLHAWAAKWHYSKGELAVLVMQAYDSCSEQPARRLFVPFFD